jgi:hypothetical protein
MDLTRQLVWALPSLMVAALIAWLIYWDYRKRRLVYEERRLMIERGITPPATVSPWGGWPAVKQHEQQLLYEERRLRIEKGLPVPPLPEPTPWTPDDYLRWGMVALSLGIGGIVATNTLAVSRLHDAEYARAWAAGLGPLLTLLGLGLIVYGWMTRKRRSE